MDLARRVPKPGGTYFSGSYFSRLERGWAHAPLYVYLLAARALEVDQWELFAADDVRHDPRPGELVLLRVLREARISAEEALVRIGSWTPPSEELSP